MSPVYATNDEKAKQSMLADRLNGKLAIVVANQENYHKIYGPGVINIPKDRKVKILYTKINENKPENIVGDIWCRIVDLITDFSMWVPFPFLVLVHDNK